MKNKVILHSDLNGFYASVECMQNPELRKLPVAVCGDIESRHGIILAKNELAKRFGIKTGQVIWQAKQLCPRLVLVKANFDKYLRFSSLAKSIYARYSDYVESFGIDECWLDVSGCGSGETIALEIREAIKNELGITASIGVSWNKVYAKLGSDIKKPDATTVINRDNFKKVVFPLPASDLLMVGRATAAKLKKYGIFTIGQLAGTDPRFLCARFGKWGDYLWRYANGLDDTAVSHIDFDQTEKSVGNSTTTSRDLVTLDDVYMIVTVLAESVASRLRDSGIKGNVVHMSVRNGELNWWGKQATLDRHTFVSSEIISAAMELFRAYDFSAPIRSLGVRVAGIKSINAPEQLDMFSIKKDGLEYAIDEIRGRFGQFSIKRGTHFLDKKLTAFNPKTENVIHPQSFL